MQLVKSLKKKLILSVCQQSHNSRILKKEAFENNDGKEENVRTLLEKGL